MPGMAVVIVILIGGLVLSVKGRAAGLAAWCSGLAVLCLVSTPVASGLPGVVSTVMAVIDGAASPVLSGERTADVEDPGAHEDGSGSRGVRQVGADR